MGEELRRQIAEEAERKAELERQEAEEAKRRADEEEARKKQEAAEAAERELKEAAEKAERERAQKVQDWLKSNKFASPNDKKSANCASTYPIHEAATHGQVDIVRGLLEAKADATQKN